MSVTELLRQFKAMPAAQRKRFLKAARAAGRAPTQSRPRARRVQWPDVEYRANRITNSRIVPNLVLIEREDHAF